MLQCYSYRIIKHIICASNRSLPRCPFYNVCTLIYNSLTTLVELGQHNLKSDRTLNLRWPLVKHFREMVKTVSFLQESKIYLHSGSKSVVSGPVTSSSLGNVLKFSGPLSKKKNSKNWVWSMVICIATVLQVNLIENHCIRRLAIMKHAYLEQY